MTKTKSKPKKKPLEAPVKTEIAEDITITLKIGPDTYTAELKVWKETK